MTDKEKILAEIERLINDLGEQRDINLEDLRDFINSLPKVPVKKVWHDANEVPGYDRRVVFADKNCLGKYVGKWDNTSKWAYLSDLLKVDNVPCNEEPEFTPLEKEVVDSWNTRIDNKRIPITLKGDIKHKFRNEFHTMWQTVGEMQFANVAKAIMERLCLHFSVWGAYNLKDIGNISEEEKAKMDTEEPVSEDLDEAVNNYVINARKGYPRVMDKTDKYVYDAFKANAQWKRNNLNS